MGTGAPDLRPTIAITMGDPCGIGPEVVVKALADPRVHASCRALVVGNLYAMQKAVEITGLPLRVIEVDGPNSAGPVRIADSQRVGRIGMEVPID